MSKPFSDDDIAAMYKNSATEAPSASLDDAILAYASEQTAHADSPEAETATPKGKSAKNWWPIFGLAAGAMFVALLAPWQWVDQTLPGAQDVQQYSSPDLMMLEEAEIPPSAADAVPDAKLHKFASPSEDAPRAKSMKPALPEKTTESATSPTPAREMLRSKMMVDNEMEVVKEAITRNPFVEIEALLEEGNEVQAHNKLKDLLRHQPQLEARLPEHLKTLLNLNTLPKQRVNN
ncbi:hypothetical protein [Enterovibrio norvegicus]|uniref:Uncharacterized protein n=1 Tax=Enterovibrio norvegicus TaxID=188144 RepID=A0A2N7LG37_9GAMM|nr:hypothetical protein [Enterovibrio norvegicus]PMN94446.1 hypothetical protein BCT23_09720 [Enterovibrio norvegicus]